jgi:protein tyrosine phosphatase (PTP) superfamily phosphohydrolase (DUF442 family)
MGEGLDEGVCAAAEPAEAADFNWVAPNLAVGAAFASAAIPSLVEAGLRAVVDLRSEAHDDPDLMRRHGVAFLHLPADDLRPVSPAQLDEGVDFVTAQLALGAPVLIHCREGIGRSVTLMLAVLVAQGGDPLAAMSQIKDRRYFASPSPAQFEVWAQWLDRRGVPAPSFEDFAAIAYRHLAR